MRLGRTPAALALLVLVAGCTRPASISWQPQPLVITLPPNAYRVYDATLHVQRALTAVVLTPTPSLHQLVSVVPGTVANLGDDATRRIRVAVHVPAASRPGERISGGLEAAGTGGTLTESLEIAIDVVPSTPEGALGSLRAALEQGEESAYLAQFVPLRRDQERATFARLTDTARLALAQTLRTAERISLSDDGSTAEYRLYVLLGTQRFESSILLQHSPTDGVWRVVRF